MHSRPFTSFQPASTRSWRRKRRSSWCARFGPASHGSLSYWSSAAKRHCCSPQVEPSSVSGRKAAPTHPVKRTSTARDEVVRRRFADRGLPKKVVDLLMAGTRSMSRSAYRSAWNNWAAWCGQRSLDPLWSDVNAIIDFLSSLHAAGRA